MGSTRGAVATGRELLMVGRHSRGIVRKEDESIQVCKQFLLPLRVAKENSWRRRRRRGHREAAVVVVCESNYYCQRPSKLRHPSSSLLHLCVSIKNLARPESIAKPKKSIDFEKAITRRINDGSHHGAIAYSKLMDRLASLQLCLSYYEQ